MIGVEFSCFNSGKMIWDERLMFLCSVVRKSITMWSLQSFPVSLWIYAVLCFPFLRPDLYLQQVVVAQFCVSLYPRKD